MTFIRFVRVAIFAAALCLSTSVFAQGGQTPIPSLQNGQWCSPAPNAPGGSVCAGSAESACRAGNAYFHPQDGDSHIRAVIGNSGTTANCQGNADLVRSRGRLWLGEGSASISCSTDFVASGSECVPKPVEPCDTCGTGGITERHGTNPIDMIYGIKIQSFEDFKTADGRLMFNRHYASRSATFGLPTGIGERVRGWSFGDIPRIELLTRNNQNQAEVYFPNHKRQVFTCSSGNCAFNSNATNSGVGYGMARIDASDVGFQDTFTTAQSRIPIVSRGGVRYIFKSQQDGINMHGVLSRIEYPSGYAIDVHSYLRKEYIIEGTPEDLDPYGNDYRHPTRFVVTGMTDSFGRSITFEYSTNVWINNDDETRQTYFNRIGTTEIPTLVNYKPTLGPIRGVNFPDGSKLILGYDSVSEIGQVWNLKERLVSATRVSSDGTTLSSESYKYEDADYPYKLTGLTDSAGVRYASWTYDENGFADSSQHAGGVDNVDLNYEIIRESAQTKLEVTATNALQKVTVYKPDYYGDFFAEIEGEPSASCIGDFRRVQDFSNIRILTDKEGRVTRQTRNTRGYVTSEIKAQGLPEAVSTTTQWHPIWRLPTVRVMPGVTDTRTYDSVGRLLTRTLTDTSGEGTPDRIWAYTYVGPNVASIDGPLAGSSDTVFFEWTGPNLTAVTNEVGHRTQILGHNAIGAPTLIRDPNNILTRVTYDAEHKVTSIVEDDGGREATTLIAYNAVDNVTRITRPDGVWTRFIYDDARRLMGIEDSGGESITLTRNLMGGITNQVVKGADGGTTFSMTQVMDEMNRIIAMRTFGQDSGEALTNLEYDREHNLTNITDPRRNSWSQAFDGLDRLISETDPLGATTQYELDANDDSRNSLAKVKDARDVETLFVRNGFGELLREVSLERGTTTYEYDDRGLVTRMTDARGVVLDYTYDAAGRLLSEDYAGSNADDVSYEYDLGDFGVGQLSAITEGFGRTEYTYDALGFVTSETRAIGTQNYVTGYTHDPAGNVLTTTYPSGLQVQLTRDSLSRVTDIAMLERDGTQTSILNAATYRPYGGVTQAVFGDGYVMDVSYDTSDRAVGLSRMRNDGALMNLRFVHDAAGDILAIEDVVRPDRSQTFGYDPVSRLTSAEGGYGLLDYRYNLGGDRLERNMTPIDGQAQQELYAYSPTTAQLLNVSTNGTTTRDFTYAASGQMLTDVRPDATVTTALNARGRIASVTKDGTNLADYGYDIFEQRISKTTSDGQNLHYHYDDQGRLFAETDAATGEAVREYVWFGLTPIAVRRAGEGGEVDRCSEDVLTELRDRLTTRQATLVTVTERVTRLTDTLGTRQATEADVQARRNTVADRLANLPDNLPEREAELAARLATLDARLTQLDGVVMDVETRLADAQLRLAELEVLVADLTERVTRREIRCARLAENGDGTDIVTTGDGGAQLNYIHADHLGRPAFVTDTTGAVLWDAGITTPFGVSVDAQAIGDAVQTTAALVQPIMFPGQYRDTETGYDDNWHRTYDPALGRYLQSDPIGLAGGLNRYAYVGGSPVGRIDPEGLNSITLEPGFAFDMANTHAANTLLTSARAKNVYGFCLGIGSAAGGYMAATYYEARNLAAINAPAETCEDCSRPEQTQIDDLKHLPSIVGASLTCPIPQRNSMQQSVRNACKAKGRKRGCKAGMDLETLELYALRNLECVNARRGIMNVCYGGGDQRHAIELARAQASYLKCLSFK